MSPRQVSFSIHCMPRCQIHTTGAVPAMKPKATAIGDPQEGRWKITSMFDGRRFCIPKFRPDHFFRHENLFQYSLPFKVIAQPSLTTALRHYTAGPLFKSRLRPWLITAGVRADTNHQLEFCDWHSIHTSMNQLLHNHSLLVYVTCRQNSPAQTHPIISCFI